MPGNVPIGSQPIGWDPNIPTIQVTAVTIACGESLGSVLKTSYPELEIVTSVLSANKSNIELSSVVAATAKSNDENTSALVAFAFAADESLSRVAASAKAQIEYLGETEVTALSIGQLEILPAVLALEKAEIELFGLGGQINYYTLQGIAKLNFTLRGEVLDASP